VQAQKATPLDMLSDILVYCEITNAERVEVAGIFKNKRTDDLGMGTIVYFPFNEMERRRIDTPTTQPRSAA
jgi:hypothetical protein